MDQESKQQTRKKIPLDKNAEGSRLEPITRDNGECGHRVRHYDHIENLGPMLPLDDYIWDGGMVNHHKQDENNLEVIPQINTLIILKIIYHDA